MREIKFRARTFGNVWVYGNLIRQIKDDGLESCFIRPIKIDDNPVPISHINKSTIGQFTGLYDKNGKEIYEGDIVSLDKDLLGSYVVKYDIKNTRFSMYRDNYEQAGFNLETMKNYKVIGNIYDNPELIKE